MKPKRSVAISCWLLTTRPRLLYRAPTALTVAVAPLPQSRTVGDFVYSVAPSKQASRFCNQPGQGAFASAPAKARYFA
jgi:hypothetical protein